jgi:uncharacterized Zn-binding protein involved in type VI secretion
MPPAARVGDDHVCPMVGPGSVPHVGGPVFVPGDPTVRIGYAPAAREGDLAICVGVAGAMDKIIAGAATVFIGHMPAARLGDPLAHGGVIKAGCPTVFIGSSSQGAALAAASGGFVDVCEKEPTDPTV